MFGGGGDEGDGPRPGPTQCHDITLYPEIGLAGGACEGYGFLIDITDPVNAERMEMGGSWSVYWYNGLIVSSEIARGLDILELEPSEHLSGNEIESSKTVEFEHFNVQGQQMFVWPAAFALARAYADQLERSGGLSDEVE